MGVKNLKIDHFRAFLIINEYIDNHFKAQHLFAEG